MAKEEEEEEEEDCVNDASEDASEDEESWEEEDVADETKAELEVKLKSEDVDGWAVVEGVPDDWTLWDDSTSDVEMEEIEEPEEIDEVLIGTVEVAAKEFVWVALTCSEDDTVDISVIFSVVEETTELAKVTGYTLVVV